tara:strand:- start:1711 stop:3933 length:2223 start_codon:yes stop_codon:yes gene_type:complete
MLFAGVGVNSGFNKRDLFTYYVPDHILVQIGDVVVVPFGKRVVLGVVFFLNSESDIDSPRNIIDVLSFRLSDEQISLVKWMIDHYISGWYETATLMLPPILKSMKSSVFTVLIDQEKLLKLEFNKIESLILKYLSDLNPKQQTWEKILSEFGDEAVLVLKDLLLRGVLISKNPRKIEFVKCAVNQTTKQNTEILGVKNKLTKSQQKIVDEISVAIGIKSQSSKFLFQDTFSFLGRDNLEMYFSIITACLDKSLGVIIMLPEINQVIRMEEKCKEYFGDEVVALHGDIVQRKKNELWNDIRNGKYKLVIGTRISIFAPITNLGLIIIFDEHDGAYKQQELSPRYNARDVAIKRGDIDDSVVLMSSRTPDVRVYYATLKDKVRFLSLSRKTKVQNNLFKLQQTNTEIVDMREELRKGKSSLFSGKLISRLSDALNKGLKALLFLNRRGNATLIQCRKCDYVVSCKYCDLPMNLHTSSERFLCHQCGFNLKIFKNCPTCQTVKLSYYGSGTELAVNEINRIFPKAKVVRWDSDSIDLKRKTINTYQQEILDGNYDVLVGTQAIPKDFDVSSVGFFGVIVSDVGFNSQSFLITERSFQLLSQVMTYIQSAKLVTSRAIVQTFDPSNNAVVAAVKSDYDLFYKEEIEYRLLSSNPPFSRIIRLMYSHRDYDTCYQEIHKMANMLDDYIKNTKLQDVYIIAPSRGYPFRLRNKYRFQIFVKGTRPQRVIYPINFSRGWVIDVDPIE